MHRTVFFFLTFMAIVHVSIGQVLENYDGQNEVSKKNSWLGTESQIDFTLNFQTYPLANLYLEIPEESTVFIDGKLWFIAVRDTTFLTPMGILSEEFGKGEVLLTLIGSNLDPEKVSVKKVLGTPSTEPIFALEGEQINPTPRKTYINEFTDFYFFSLFLILFLLAFYRAGYPYLLTVMLRPLSIINAEDFSESGSLQKFFSFDIQLYLFIVSMMISQVILTAGVMFKPIQMSEWISLDLINLLLIWIGLSFVILILTILKFIAIRIISYLFDLGKTDFAHFFYLLRMLVFSVALVSLITSLLMVNDFTSLESNYPWFISGMFWIYLFAVLGLFLIMMNRLSFKKYHLFTYLCIAELVPFLIFSKWIWVLIN